MKKEELWLERLKKYIQNYECPYGVCSWWLRLEYEDEKIKTSQINYYLNKSVEKGLLGVEKTKSYTKYFLL